MGLWEDKGFCRWCPRCPHHKPMLWLGMSVWISGTQARAGA